MNKKGFTTIELILTIALVIVIMATITSVTYTYRDKKDYEQTWTEISDFKNDLTKIIYDDILNENDKAKSITKTDNYNYNIVTTNGTNIPLRIVADANNQAIIYNNITYPIPGAKDGLITLDIENVIFHEDAENNIYTLDIVFRHRDLDEVFKIHFAIT